MNQMTQIETINLFKECQHRARLLDLNCKLQQLPDNWAFCILDCRDSIIYDTSSLEELKGYLDGVYYKQMQEKSPDFWATISSGGYLKKPTEEAEKSRL